MSNIKLFQTKQVRTYWNENEEKWYFAVVDVIEILTESIKPRDYWYRLKKREKENGIELSTNCRQLKMKAKDGKMRDTEIADTETLLRIIQSISSPKAEPFKRWLAKVGYERLEEIENPELASKRTREIYKTKGYSDEWIEKRMRSIAIRDELTDEWKKRGVKERIEYAILTAEISKATFGLTPSQYKEVKGLKKQNLRDHMTDLELIFSMLGEASTTKVAKAKDVKGFVENKKAAIIGGKIAGNARKELEKESGENIISSENYLPEKTTKQLRGKK
ncbi:MAG: Bro-N domain-containing protein [Bacteroidales bacterium]|nr:Bro-N domain-containing protein [Bacteroidales bacterium]